VPLAAVLCVPLTSGCGKVGPPRLPELAVPLAPQPVAVRNLARGLEITFRRPRRYLDGVPLDDLGSFEVSRSCEPTPGFVPVADVPVVDHGRFQKQGEISLVDFDPRPGQLCTYRVVAVTLDGYRSAPADSTPTLREAPPADVTREAEPSTPSR